jgi:hypothetical protein
MRVHKSQVDLAYRKLKSLVYYDKTDLSLRASLAKFECDKGFSSRLKAVHAVVNADVPISEPLFRKWLLKVGFRIVPKKLSPGPQDRSDDPPDRGRFITNVTSVASIQVDKVNYFFDGPIELHLIAVLWIMLEGRRLDEQIGPESCGARLAMDLHSGIDDSIKLFAKYHEQYARWRDTGIRRAKQLLEEERRSVAILGLDVQEYYYRVNIDFNEVMDALKLDNPSYDAHAKESFALLKCVQQIGLSYRDCIAPLLSKTHQDIGDAIAGLPIGLCSSQILANWYLCCLDSKVLASVRPAYYGRYVDDILLVVPVPIDPTAGSPDPVGAFMEDLLVRPGILRTLDGHAYEIGTRPGLRLQQSKCILQYFDARHSIAGLEKFRKKLEENGSDFLLLPVDEADNSMEDVAYELLYEGSVNKFRSVKGVAENRYELAKHLAKQTILHLLTDEPPDRAVTKGLQKFFKGRSAIEFYDLWERVFTLLGIAGDRTTLKAFSKQIRTEIDRVRFEHPEVTLKIVNNLIEHFELSLAMTESVCSADVGLSDLVDGVYSETFRRANLLRHHFVRRPLLNFTSYTGPLSTRELSRSVKVDEQKTEFSPRFVNFDECMLLAYSGDIPLKRQSPFEVASEIFEAINRRRTVGIEWKRGGAGNIGGDGEL